MTFADNISSSAVPLGKSRRTGILFSRKKMLGFLIAFLASVLYVLFSREPVYMILTRLSVILVFGYCILCGSREKFILNPYYLFCLVPLSLLLYSASISSFFLIELQISTWWFAIANMVAFLFAFGKTKSKRTVFAQPFENKKELIKAACILGVLGSSSFLYKMFTGKTLFLATILQLLLYAGLMCALKSKSKITIVIFYVYVVFQMASSINKFSLLLLLITTLIGISKYYVVTPKGKKWMIVIAAVFGVLMLLIFDFRDYVRTGGTLGEYINGGYAEMGEKTYYTSRIDWEYSSKLMMPYMYFTTPWANLQYVIDTQSWHTYGLWFIKPVLGWLQLDGLAGDMYTITSYSSFNTFTYLSVLYKDFGYIGSVFGSAFLGFFVKKVYNSFNMSESPLSHVCYVYTACATMEMFFSNHFFMQSYPFTILVIMIIYNLIFRKWIALPKKEDNKWIVS